MAHFQNPFRLLWSLMALLLMATGCGHGAEAVNPDPPALPGVVTGPASPVITGVTPRGGVGLENELVVMEATATNEPTSWQWNFGGASKDGATSSQATPQIRLGPGASWTCSVVASNAVGSSAPFLFTLDIAPCEVTPAGDVGAIGDRVTFSANADVPGVEWHWDFGGGAIPNTSTERNPRVTLRGSSLYWRGDPATGTVSVMRPNSVTAVRRFTYNIADPPDEDRLKTSFVRWRAEGLEAIDGRPVVLLTSHRKQPHAAKLAMAHSSRPVDASQWTWHELNVVSQNQAALAVDGTAVCVAYRPGTLNVIRVVTADAADPAVPGGWIGQDAFVADAGGNSRFDVAYVRGRPVVALQWADDTPLRLLVAPSRFPQAPESWSALNLAGESRVWQMQLAGTPTAGAVAYTESIFPEPVDKPLHVAVLAPSGDLVQPEDWTTSVAATGVTGNYYSFDGRAAWRDQALAVAYTTTAGLWLATPRVEMPSGVADWDPTLVVPIEASGRHGPFVPDLHAIAGTDRGWAIAYTVTERSGFGSSATQRLARSLLPAPRSPADWHTVILDEFGDNGSNHEPFYTNVLEIHLASGILTAKNSSDGAGYSVTSTRWEELLPLAPEVH